MTESYANQPADRAPGVAGPAPTDARVESAVRRLADLDALPPVEHAPVYEDVHHVLADLLGQRAEK